MITRRTFNSALAAYVTAGTSMSLATKAAAQDIDNPSGLPFDEILTAVLADDQLIVQGRYRHDRQLEDLEALESRGLADRKPSQRGVAKKAHDLIITFEVSNEGQYTRRYERPIWPHGQSGVTVGIGYDIGYVKKDWLRADWGDYMSSVDIEKLENACQVTGEDARDLIPSLTSVRIKWSVALSQFVEKTLPLYIAETEERLPNTEKLSPTSLGALVSLVYNRGASFQRTSDRFREMRNIRRHMAREEFDRIPDEIRTMKRHWQGQSNLRGLLVRRELEAKLFESGIHT